METAAYLALSRQVALHRHTGVIANNVANMTASGFKADALMLEAGGAMPGAASSWRSCRTSAARATCAPGR